MKELQERRRELQEEMVIAERMKKVAVVTENKKAIRIANQKIEKLVLLIEEVDKKIKIIKDELKARIEAAKAELDELVPRRDLYVSQVKKTTNKYVEDGDEQLLVKIELAHSEIKKINNRIKQLEKIAESKDLKDLVDEEDTIVENDENKLDEFIKQELEEERSTVEIVDDLNKIMPSSLDAFVDSNGFKAIYDLYMEFHYPDRDGVSTGTYKPLTEFDDNVLDKYYSMDFSELNYNKGGLSIDYGSLITNHLGIISNAIREADELREAGLENTDNYREYFKLNEVVKQAEANIVDVICDMMMRYHKMYIGDRLYSDKGTDFTAWTGKGENNNLHDAAAELIFQTFKEKANPVMIPMRELEKITTNGMITLEDLEGYMEKRGMLQVTPKTIVNSGMFDDPISEGEWLTGMFANPEEETVLVRSGMFDDPISEVKSSGMFDDPRDDYNDRTSELTGMFADPVDTVEEIIEAAEKKTK